MRSFVRAAELGQFRHAADELGVTQQAVSKRIAALERELGVRLFTRTPRGVELTGDGRAFLPHARGVVAGADRAVAAVRPGA
ncbi:LysR family transcriptional regulator, partial [Micromonospora aurantiaca]|nr:LysR family transcriptional regulator [Micromonospora aurantiaca]